MVRVLTDRNGEGCGACLDVRQGAGVVRVFTDRNGEGCGAFVLATSFFHLACVLVNSVK